MESLNEEFEEVANKSNINRILQADAHIDSL